MDVKIVLVALAILTSSECQEIEEESPELHPLDGYFNNLLHPDWGAVETVLLRKSPPAYADGVYLLSGQNRPNPFDISERAHRSNTPQSLGSVRGRTAMQVYFGQQVVEEIMDVQRPGCPREYENIPVPRNNTLYRDSEAFRNARDTVFMPFPRSRFDQRTGQAPSNPRQQLNEITPYLDGQLMYGPARTWTDAIREFRGGKLLALDPSKPVQESLPAINDIRLPFANPPNPRENTRERRLLPVARFWRLGNPRAMENPFLLSFGVLWFRWHNYLAEEYIRMKNIQESDLEKYDEQIFNYARKWVVASHQKIVLYDWLPRWLFTRSDFANVTNDESIFYPIRDPKNNDPRRPTCGPYAYNPNIHPGITTEFQTAAMRYGHTLVTPGLWRRGAKTGNQLQQGCNWFPTNLRLPNPPVQQTHGLRLCNAYWNSQESVEENLDALYRGLASTLGEKEDHIMVEDLAGQVFGPLEFSRRDLAALNIQRARDHGLTDYQTIRETFGLPRLNSWQEINPNNTLTQQAIEALRLLYEGSGLNGTSPEDVDLFTGGLMETTEDGPGDLFRVMMVEQFCRIRDGDRFWYENLDNKIFNQTEIDRINNEITLGYILSKVTNLRVEGQLDRNNINVSRNQADIQADPFVHRGDNDTCQQPQQLDPNVAPVTVRESNATGSLYLIENCTSWQTFDYFFGMESNISFPLTFIWIGLVVPATIGVMLLMARQRKKKMMAARKKKAHTDTSTDPNTFNVVEWVGKKEGERNVVIKFDSQRKKLHVNDRRGKPLRMIDLRPKQGSAGKSIRLWNADDQPVVSVRADGEIDLVLRFAAVDRKTQFSSKLKSFAEGIGANYSTNNFAKAELIFNSATTKEDRQKLLDKFFRVICLQAFKDKTSKDLDLENLDHETAKKIAEIQLTRTEFAEALGLKPTSIFVRNMFLLVDADRSGFVSFREFLDFFVVLSSQDAESKIHLIFSMYDIQRRGKLSKKDFANMIKSLLDLSDSSLDERKMEELVQSMYKAANLSYGADITFEDFKRIFASEEYAGTLQKATLNLDGVGDYGQQPVKQSANTTIRARRATVLKNYTQKGATKGKGLKRQQSVVHVTTHQTEYPKTPFAQKMYEITSYISYNRLEIFWGTLFTLVLIGIFLERAFYYSFERETGGLRRIAGYGVTVTRGAASAMMFTYCSLLITMSRNMITFFRETFLHRFFPWDSMHALHKYIAYQALLFTFVHVIGHGINLYHISTQTSGDGNCYFMEYFRAQDVLASFHYWAYTTITGLTGIILTLIVIVMYVFATPYARRNAFNAFWGTHSLYIFLYIFMIMHGLGRLVQAPITHTYLIGPLFIFIIDKLISISRKKIECRVVKAELLPSDVTALVFQRPTTFDYKSGQWVRIACLELGENEYHPFTISSAPHEEYLSLHIRAVGPWTYNLRNLYDPDNLEGRSSYPSVYVDGPYGEGHQDWYRYEVAVLVGGGIGVTPFASILKDIVHKSKIADLRFPCKKVYFLWVTRTQKQFEWMTDIIREVENVDSKQFMDTHIFVTQFKEKFDLRTTMLYICERHFQKVAGKSLFTGLSAVTHFGRPDFQDFLKSVKMEHPNVRNFGVFSCGPPNMTNNLDSACTNLNKREGATFVHHFENF
ncbi:dual oxidase 2-like [Saccostrea cucullata]|uniref:dual oxidase 2-like n=1 Tax=Saccostrea cuccullata TaxID=36930 RepID=UPI002ED3214A